MHSSEIFNSFAAAIVPKALYILYSPGKTNLYEVLLQSNSISFSSSLIFSALKSLEFSIE